MKKIYFLFFALSLLLLAESGFSQSYLLKSELLPDQNNRDSRFAVQATVMDNDTWCKVTWPDPVGYYQELFYDDGEVDDFFLWAMPGNMNANKFHSYYYPFMVTGGLIYVGDGSFPGPFLGTSFRVMVFDDDGEDGLPGTALDSMDVTVNNYEWVEFEGMTTTITEGDFYLAMKQMAPSPNTAPVGVDLDNPTYFKSYVHFVGAPNWVLSPLQDFMIRAWIVGYNEPPRNIDYFQVARFSDFYPCGTSLYCDTIILDTIVYASEYDDYAWDTLAAGLYSYGVKTHFTDGVWSDYDVSNAVIHLMYSFPASCFYQADTANMPLIICPPYDLNGAIPNYFLGFNLYRDWGLIDFLPPSTTSFAPSMEQPGIYTYELTAVYDFSPFGYPGEAIESCALTSEYVMRIGFPLPFLENWDLGSFELDNWTIGGPNWSINGQLGNPAPTAQFTWDPIQENYEISLESYPLLADSLTAGQIYLDFHLKLSSVVPTGTEKMLVQVWNWESQVWSTVNTYSNLDGSFDWVSEHLDITDSAMSNIFKIRFSAQGENSINILSWFIDNIHVYRDCKPPQNLEAGWVNNGIELNWDSPVGPQDQWIHWDDGGISGTSVSAGLDWCAAARWTPDQLTDFKDALLTKIAFVPGQGISTYSVRVWKGENAANLLIDQEVPSPVIGQWNTITLTTPVPIDITEELWVGYHILLEYGYPAGIDNGPAIDGYGNMLYFGFWQTMLEVNPELDYNWSIKAFIEQAVSSDSAVIFNIYRSDNGYPYYLRDISEQNYYLDDSVCGWTSVYQEYKITALYSYENDTCESDFSNIAAEICEGINDETREANINIYPNPCKDILKIESSIELGLISLYNSFGELMLKKKVDGRQFEIQVAAFPVGVYMIRVETGGQVISKKVMVVH